MISHVADILGSLFWGTLICIFLFGFNPWSRTVDWIWKLRGKAPPFATESRAPRSRSRISTGSVFVTTAVRDGNVVQEHVVARDEQAARRIAADNWRIAVDEVEATEVYEKVLRR